MANSVDPNQIGAVCSGSALFVSILNSSAIICGRGLQQATFQMHSFLGALRVKSTFLEIISGIW